MLEIKNLHAAAGGVEILKGLDLARWRERWRASPPST
jgi:Fe-S cluster assembly ATPase SufC